MMKSFFKKKSDEFVVNEIASVVEAVQTESAKPTGTSGVRIKLPLTHRTSAKVIAFLLVLIMPVVALGSAFGALFMIDEELYTTPEWSYKHTAMQNLAESDVTTIMNFLTGDNMDDGRKLAAQYLSARNIASIAIVFPDDSGNNWSYDGGKREGSMVFSGTWYRIQYSDGPECFYSQHKDYSGYHQTIGTVDVTLRLADQFTEQDTYYFVDRVISIIYALRYWVYVIGFAQFCLRFSRLSFLCAPQAEETVCPMRSPVGITRSLLIC